MTALPPSDRRALVAVVGAGLLHLLLLERAALTVDATWDEPGYMYDGVRQVTQGVVASNPLPHMAFGLVQVAAGVQEHPTDDVQGGASEAALGARRLHATRQATVLVTVVAGIALARAALYLGPVAAVVAWLGWILSPSVLAFGSLVMLDGWAAAWLCLGAWAAAAWVSAPGWRRAAGVGAAIGAAVACKVSAGLAGVVAALVVAGWQGRRGGTSLAALVVSFVWTVGVWSVLGAEPEPAADGARGGLEGGLWETVAEQWGHGFVTGHPNALWGQVSATGWWWYYLAAVPMKTTLGGQGLAILAACMAWRRRAAVDLALLSVPLLVLLLFSLGKTQLGIRYLLPAWPFALLWIGLGVQRWVDAGRGRWIPAALLLMSAVEVVVISPDYLSYFSPWIGGPAGGLPLLPVGSDLCQGRADFREDWPAEPPGGLYYVPCNRELGVGLPAQKPGCQPAPGLYAVHASELFRPTRLGLDCLAWLRSRQPDHIYRNVLYVYDVR